MLSFLLLTKFDKKKDLMIIFKQIAPDQFFHQLYNMLRSQEFFDQAKIVNLVYQLCSLLKIFFFSLQFRLNLKFMSLTFT